MLTSCPFIVMPSSTFVIPANAGPQPDKQTAWKNWVPAFAEMKKKCQLPVCKVEGNAHRFFRHTVPFRRQTECA